MASWWLLYILHTGQLADFMNWAGIASEASQFERCGLRELTWAWCLIKILLCLPIHFSELLLL